MSKIYVKNLENFMPGELILSHHGNSLYQAFKVEKKTSERFTLIVKRVGEAWDGSPADSITAYGNFQLLCVDAGLRKSVQARTLNAGDLIQWDSTSHRFHVIQSIMPRSNQLYIRACCIEDDLIAEFFPAHDQEITVIEPLSTIPQGFCFPDAVQVGQEIGVVAPNRGINKIRGIITEKETILDQALLHLVLVLEDGKRQSVFLESDTFVEVFEPPTSAAPIKGHRSVEMWV